MTPIIRSIKKIIPNNIYKKAVRPYHFLLSFLGAAIYGFPSRKINVVAVTGTKGKTSTVEITNAILEEAGYKTAIASTLRFKIGKDSKPNMFKMTMPGRFVIQKFLKEALNEKCQYAIIEITSEAQVQFRNRYIYLNSLIFTNISPEHIESHGSYENYRNAKLNIARSMENTKKSTAIIVNKDDKESDKFLELNIKEKKVYSLKDAEPWKTSENGSEMTWKNTTINTRLPGKFNIYNILAGATYSETQNISPDTIKRAIEKFDTIKGRVEKIKLDPSNPLSNKQDFSVIVDYAHTPDSLRQFYEVFKNSRKICVLGNTGGGRDTWKRSEMAKIADRECDSVILTNEDPYDEDPLSIVNHMANFISQTPLKIIMDRQEAIHEAISQANKGDVVLITGKGTDPYIMEANGKKTPWSDAQVSKKELEKILANKINHA